MIEFILDKNVDIEPTQSEYPKYFFDALGSKGNAKLVVGGSTYNAEMKSKIKLLNLVNQLTAGGRVRKVDDAKVDKFQGDLISRISETLGACPSECDDHHIFALAMISNCLNVITKETRMATCRDKIRKHVGHDYCPALRVIRTEAAFNDIRGT